MTEKKLSSYLGLMLIALNIGVLLLVLVCLRLGALDSDQTTTIVAVIAPMLSCYGVAAVRYIVKERHKKEDNSKPLDPVFVIVAFILPITFAGVIALMIFFQADGKVFKNFEEFKRMLLLVEAAFGGYMGQTMYSMFTRPESTTSPE